MVEALGYQYAGGRWVASSEFKGITLLSAEGDALHALLVRRADELMGCTENSDEERELEAITNAIEAYEAVRWPEGKICN